MTATAKALWTWNTTNQYPIPTAYANGQQTKTGVTPSDLRNFVGIPLVYRHLQNTPMADTDLLRRIRRSEDWIEQQTSILLTPSWVASPPARTALAATNEGIITTSPSGVMNLGIDYDIVDAAYDFKFARAKDEGWMIQQLRYKPLRIVDGGITAIKSVAYLYPLLAMYLTMPPTWFVEDLDAGLLRIVPNANLGLLPLLSLQLAVEGFSESVPGGIAIQYTAGLTPTDYAGQYSFMHELILCDAAASALSTAQGTVNLGVASTETSFDGVVNKIKYVANGPYANEINRFVTRRDELLETAKWQVGGPYIEAFG